MLESLVVGFVLGFVLAIPPGPVAVTAMKLTLDNGVKHGRMVAFGTSIVDVFFALVAVFATGFLVHLFSDITSYNPLLFLIFQIIVIAVLMLFGLTQLKQKKSEIKIDPDNCQPKALKFLKKVMNRGPFFLGAAVAFTNIANPTFFSSLSFVTLTVQKYNLIEITAASSIMFSVGFGAGNFGWIYLLVKVLAKVKHRLNENIIYKIKKFAGFTLIGFGTLLGYRVIAFTHWQDIFRFIFAF